MAAKEAVVCGAGVIGACAAYFLGKGGIKVTVVDNCGVATAASGKAGGFLALDWCDGSPVSKLARASFELHQQLADELQGADSYGYRRLDTLSVAIEAGKSSKISSSGGVPSWVNGSGVRKAKHIGSRETTAQVHPGLFTKKMMSTAEAKYGANFLKGEVQEIVLGDDRKVRGVIVDGELINAEIVVIAMGPWSGKMKMVSDLTQISGLKAHSIVVKPTGDIDVSAHALFLKYVSAEGKVMDPEVYPRPTGEVYVCGMSEEVEEIPADADAVEPRKDSIEMLKRIAAAVSSELAEAQVKAEQACLLPISQDGRPLIGKMGPEVKGVYIATGHGCWGILNAPATAAALTQLIIDGDSSLVNLSPFDPSRFL